MYIKTFFKILNKKIEYYNKMAKNPFTIPQPVVLIWIEEDDDNSYKKMERET